MRRRESHAFALLIAGPLVCGCGGGASDDAGSGDHTDAAAPTLTPTATRSGSRLEVRWWDAGEGALAFSGFLHDTLLDLDCAMTTAVDGRRRCLPVLAFPASSGYEIGFADPACTVRVAVHRPCAGTPGYLIGTPRPASACATRYGTPIHATGEALAGSTYYQLTPDCQPLTIEPGTELVLLGDELPPETFVGADLVPGEGTRLSPHLLVADDGTVLATSNYDQLLEAACDAAGPTGARVCAPTARALNFEASFADAMCSQALALDTLHAVPACEPATAAWAPDGRAQVGYLGLSRVGEEVFGPRYSGRPSACTLEMRTDPPRAWLLGAPFEEGDFAPLVQVTDGTGRVVARRLQADDGSALAHATQLFDTMTNVACDPMRFSDGYRCVSGSSLADLYFSDPTCTTPMVLADASGGRAPMAIATHRTTDACDGIEVDAVYAVGTRITPPGVWVRDRTGSCHPPSTTIPDMVFYERGEQIEAPALTLR